MSKSSAKTAITNVFKTNGQGSITGATSQSALTGMLDILYADLASAGIIAVAYSASSTYAVGDYCIYNEGLYRCSATISTAEAWNASHWTATTVAAELALRASVSALSSHTSNTSNPHSVTKAQVGLGNCDNTSDANKPLSTVAQEAIYPLQADVESLIDNEQAEPNFSELPLLCGQPSILFGNGTPAEAVVPDNWRQFANGGYNWNGLPSAWGQQYINYAVSTGGRYIAVKDGYGALKWLNM